MSGIRVALLLCASVLSAHAGLITNGSFESGIPPAPEFTTLYAPDGTSITGWNVAAGSVDYVNLLWPAADSSRSLDLNGLRSQGTISQTFPTVPGLHYLVTFSMAGNPDGGARTTALEVSAGGSSQIFTFVVPALSRPYLDIGWATMSWVFQAASDSTTLAFASRDNTNIDQYGVSYGPTLDDVSVEAIPEPGTFGLLALGLLATAFIRRRR